MSTHIADTNAYLRHMLWIVFGISVAGVVFSATLSYHDLTSRLVSCPAVGAPGTIFGIPACVFGLLMFSLLALVSGFALIRSGGAAEIRVRAAKTA